LGRGKIAVAKSPERHVYTLAQIAHWRTTMVKRYGNLYPQIVTYENLYTAYRKQPPPQNARNGFRGYEAGAGGNLCSRDFQIARLKAEFWGGVCPRCAWEAAHGAKPPRVSRPANCRKRRREIFTF